MDADLIWRRRQVLEKMYIEVASFVTSVSEHFLLWIDLLAQ